MGGPLGMVPWARDTRDSCPHWNRDAAHQLTLLLHTARGQGQVIDGHGPPSAGHSLDQHLQESTVSAALHIMGGIRVTPGSHGMEGARTCHGQTHILPGGDSLGAGAMLWLTGLYSVGWHGHGGLRGW